MLRISPRSIASVGLVLLSAALAGASAAHAAACRGQVQLDAEYYVTPIPGYAYCVAAGDWNEDGHPDLAVAHRGATMTILLGRGAFRLAPRQEIAVDVAPRWVVVGDMDGDGHQDLVVTGDGGTRVLAGDGQGAFHETEAFPQAGIRAAVGDLDGDGKPDIVLASGTPQLTVIFRGSGETITVPAFQYGAHFAVLADFDHDGDLDVASDGTLVWLNDGHGHLSGPTSYPTFYCLPGYMAAGDVNGDGHLDLFGVTTREGGGGGCDMLLFGNGDGTFQAPDIAGAAQKERPQQPSRRHGNVATDGSPATTARAQEPPRDPRHIPPGPEFVVLVDLNGDRKADPIRIGGDTGHELDGRLSVRSADMACAADMDGDGKLDMVVAGYNSVAIHPGNGDGTFRSNPSTWTYYPPYSFVQADFDGDGRGDVAVTTYDTDELVVALTGPDGAFKRVIRDQINPGSGTIAVADFDGDGRVDLLDAYDGVYLGNGDGTFRTPPIPAPAFGAPGDFNEDGHVDLADAEGHSVQIYLGNGDGTFRPGPTIVVEATEVSVADVDHDGHLDLVTTAGRYRPVTASVVYGRGDGTAAEIVKIPGDFYPLSWGDFDGDGLLDVIRDTPLRAEEYLSRGRTFVRSSFTDLPQSPAVGDVNGDGHADLVAGGVWLGRGDGTFDPPDVLFGPGGYTLVEDRDGDGQGDIVVAGSYDEDGYENIVTVLMNRTARNRAPSTTRARASVARAWPPNGDVVDVAIDGVNDPDGDPVAITCLGVTQDEPVTGGQVPFGALHGQVCADAIIDANGHARIRLVRDGSGNGRVYEIAFSAADSCGATSLGRVRVDVPHDQGKACIDDGQRYNSLSCGSRFAKQETSGDTDPLAVQRLAPGRWSIRYTLVAAADIQLDAFDLLGRRVARLESGRREAGSHEATWTPSRPNGVYFVRLVQGDRAMVRRCVALE